MPAAVIPPIFPIVTRTSPSTHAHPRRAATWFNRGLQVTPQLVAQPMRRFGGDQSVVGVLERPADGGRAVNLAQANALQSRDRVLHPYLKSDLLIIDDMGLRTLPKHSSEYLLEVIMRRYETRSTIMTSNRPLEEWGKPLQDVPTAGAVLDRFLHHATVFAITGESYRLKDSALAKTGGKKHA